jgi:hypothetical protein
MPAPQAATPPAAESGDEFNAVENKCPSAQGALK